MANDFYPVSDYSNDTVLKMAKEARKLATDSDYKVTDAVMTLWSNFAKSGFVTKSLISSSEYITYI